MSIAETPLIPRVKPKRKSSTKKPKSDESPIAHLMPLDTLMNEAQKCDSVKSNSKVAGLKIKKSTSPKNLKPDDKKSPVKSNGRKSNSTPDSKSAEKVVRTRGRRSVVTFNMPNNVDSEHDNYNVNHSVPNEVHRRKSRRISTLLGVVDEELNSKNVGVNSAKMDDSVDSCVPKRNLTVSKQKSNKRKSDESIVGISKSVESIIGTNKRHKSCSATTNKAIVDKSIIDYCATVRLNDESSKDVSKAEKSDRPSLKKSESAGKLHVKTTAKDVVKSKANRRKSMMVKSTTSAELLNGKVII